MTSRGVTFKKGFKRFVLSLGGWHTVPSVAAVTSTSRYSVASETKLNFKSGATGVPARFDAVFMCNAWCSESSKIPRHCVG